MCQNWIFPMFWKFQTYNGLHSEFDFFGVSKEIGISEWTVQYEFCGLPFYSLKIFFKQWSLLPSLLWITCAAHCANLPFFVQKTQFLYSMSYVILRSLEAIEDIWGHLQIVLKKQKMDKKYVLAQCVCRVSFGILSTWRLTVVISPHTPWWAPKIVSFYLP